MIPALDAAAPAARFRRWMGGRSLAQCVDDKRDNILLLRLVAALLVVFGHSVLAGRGSPIYQGIREALPATPLHVVGLLMFFATSGFLITLSFERRPELLRFLRARFLRLCPRSLSVWCCGRSSSDRC
jgi:peptidoglycan/LPS O-acetylase OafA/YrhL